MREKKVSVYALGGTFFGWRKRCQLMPKVVVSAFNYLLFILCELCGLCGWFFCVLDFEVLLVLRI